jgi:hypothetical protein
MDRSHKIRCTYIATALIVAEIGTDILLIKNRALWDNIRVIFIIINALTMAYLLQIHDEDDKPVPEADTNYKVSTAAEAA